MYVYICNHIILPWWNIMRILNMIYEFILNFFIFNVWERLKVFYPEYLFLNIVMQHLYSSVKWFCLINLDFYLAMYWLYTTLLNLKAVQGIGRLKTVLKLLEKAEYRFFLPNLLLVNHLTHPFLNYSSSMVWDKDKELKVCLPM